MDIDIDRDLGGRSVMLVGVDFSEVAQQVIAVALNLARITRAPDVHFVHVVRPGSLTGLGDWAIAVSQYERSVELARRELDALCTSSVAKLELRAFAHVRTGEPAHEIVQLASDIEADLVVIGTHSRSGVSRFLLGSVAEKIQRLAPSPVLTVKPKARPESSEIEPPCPSCHDVRNETHGAHLWCERHLHIAHSFFPPSQPPPFDEATSEEAHQEAPRRSH
jgi:nucleotide-binding universal stress UspA family protein